MLCLKPLPSLGLKGGVKDGRNYQDSERALHREGCSREAVWSSLKECSHPETSWQGGKSRMLLYIHVSHALQVAACTSMGSSQSVVTDQIPWAKSRVEFVSTGVHYNFLVTHPQFLRGEKTASSTHRVRKVYLLSYDCGTMPILWYSHLQPKMLAIISDVQIKS